MTSMTKQMIGLSVLAFTLAVALPALAQEQQDAPPPPPRENTADRADFKHSPQYEEMIKLHKEHEELESARDKLLDKCVNATKEQAEACKKERAALHEKAKELHERMKALHEKREAEHKDHAAHHHHGMMGPHDEAAPKDATPTKE